MARLRIRLGLMVMSAVAAAGAQMAVAAPPPAPATPATVQLRGTVLRLADSSPRGGVVARPGMVGLSTSDGHVVEVPAAAVRDVPSGREVDVTARVPEAVRAAASASGPSATSALARATVAAATTSPLQVSSVSLLPAGPTRYTPAVHEIWVAIVQPAGTTGRSATLAQIRAQVAGASAYWSDQTARGITLRLVRVGGAYRSALSCSESPYAMWDEAAARIGYTKAPDRHLVLSLPADAYDHGCAYGQGTIGESPQSDGMAYVTDTAWPVLAHEFGHNLGLDHARSLRCTRSDVDLAALPRGCDVAEYGYPWDVMAASGQNQAGMLSSPNAIRLGFLTPAQYVRVTSGARQVTLQPLATGAGVRAVAAVDPLSGQTYYVEYRTHVGRDRLLYEAVPAGVRVVRFDTRAANGKATLVLDATPTGRAADTNRVLSAGATFISYTSGVAVRVVSVGPGAATVRVSVGAGAALRVR